MMSFEEFGSWVAGNIKDHLPGTYREAEVVIRNYDKLGHSYTGLSVVPDGWNIAPVVDLEMFYHSLSKGAEEDAVIEQIAGLLQYEHPDIDIEQAFDYSYVRDKLYVRVCSREKNRALLESVPFTPVEDLAVSYHILMDEHDECVGSTIVTNEMLDSYGISLQQLNEDALSSGARLFPAELKPLCELISELEGMPAEKPDPVEGGDVLLLTNVRKINGASALFYPGIMEMAADDAGGSYFILPSSVNEVIIIPDDGEKDVRQLKAMVREVNRSILRDDEYLSDNVYYYDAGRKVFGIAGSAENAEL